MRNLCPDDCPICGGVGWVRLDRPLGDPMFGKLVLCPNVDQIKAFENNIGITHEELNLNWNRIAEINGMGKIIKQIKTVLNNGFGWVFIWGGYGLGKTILLKTITAETIRFGKQVSYTRMVDIIDNLRNSYTTENGSYEAETRLKYWVDVPVLCIDEFDRIRLTEYASERQFVLMDKRYDSVLRENSITIMASNTDPRLLDGYLADRIFDGRFKVIHIEGHSARPNMTSN